MKYLLLLSALLFTACWDDDGLSGPQTRPKPLASFKSSGVSLATSDTATKPDYEGRLLAMSDPQIALVWQFVGPKQFIRAPSAAVVNSKSPYDFNADLWDPPAAEVLDNPDLAIAQFWLFCDRNKNGTLDRLVHPEMAKVNARIDSLYGIYQQALAEVVASGVVVPEGVEVKDTLYVGASGVVTVKYGNREDTLWTPRSAAEVPYGPLSTIQTRFRVLSYQNEWERFFSLRKRNNDYHHTLHPAPGYVYAAELPYRRKIFPRPGGEQAFEAICRRMFAAYTDYILLGQAALGQAIAAGYPDYPYNGDTVAGADFVFARSRGHFILYLKNQEALDQLRGGEATSSFNVRGLLKAKTGYNLITCDDQYRCEVLDQDAPIRLDRGSTDAFFNPPPSKVLPPVQVPASPSSEPPRALDLPEAGLQRFAGFYNYLSFQPLRFLVKEGALWADDPNEGLLRLFAADSLVLLSPVRTLQYQFVSDDQGRILKVFAVRGSQRFVGVRDSTLGTGDLGSRIDRLLAPAGMALSAARASTLAGLRFDHGGDTLRTETDGDAGLRLLVPGLYPQRLVATDTSTLVSRALALSVSFPGDADGNIPGAFLERNGRRVFAPAIGFRPKTAREVFPGLPDTLADTASASAGSGRDRFPTLDMKPRFAHLGDSAFLRMGDGWVDKVVAGGDGMTFGQGGDHLLLRIPAQSGKAVSVVFTLVPERGAGKRRVRFSLHGGDSRDSQDKNLGGETWIEFNDKPVTLTAGPFPVGTEPYFVRVQQVATADRALAYVFGGYIAVTD